MTHYTLYKDNGEIFAVGVGQDFSAIRGTLDVGEHLLEMESDVDMDFILDGKVTERPTMPITVSVTSISGIPKDTEVFVDGISKGTCLSGTLEFEKSYLEDTFSVRLSLFPYLDYEVEV